MDSTNSNQFSSPIESLKIKSQILNPRRGFFWAARTRILFWYVLIVGFIFVASIPAFRLLLYQRVDTRVRRELKEKMYIFNKLVDNDTSSEFLDMGDGIEEIPLWLKYGDEELKRRLKPPSSIAKLEDFFNAFMAKQLPEDDTYLLTFVDGRFFKSSPRGRPEIFDRDTKLMQDWAKLTKPTKGEMQATDGETGGIIYIGYPVTFEGKTLGALVVAHTIDGERSEIIEAVNVVIQVSCIILIIALVLAWVVSGWVLSPLRLLAVTARSIGESDLNQRIQVQGKGEIAELATTFNEMMDRLQAAFSTQRNFINDAGHELRTPITIIRGHLELMGDDPEEKEETVALVLDELDRMSRFVEDLILLAKAERPDFLLLETVDVKQLTEELFIKAKGLADRNWCLDGTATCHVVIDRQRLTQAVMNMAGNATNYTSHNNTIAIGSALVKDKVHFWVRDTGEGIAYEDQKRIFERFARAANSRRRSEGAGLGLSIVKAIVEAHDGEVTLTSKPKKGSTFTIILPLQPLSIEEKPQEIKV
ncbi:MAG: HAMP domain-containing sensor histidine kinase [Cyanobacteria bacterium J06639_18]